MVMVLAGAMLITLAGVLSYARTNTDLTSRSAQYARTTAAAEAATENIIARVARSVPSCGVTMSDSMGTAIPIGWLVPRSRSQQGS